MASAFLETMLVVRSFTAKIMYLFRELMFRQVIGERNMQRKYLYAIVAIVIIIIAAVAAYVYLQTQTPTAAVTLDFWAPFSGEDSVIAFWNNVTAAYGNATGNTVRVSMYSGDEFFTKLTTALGSGSPPDLFVTYGGGELDTYVNESAVADISNLFSESWAQSQIGAGAKTSVTRNGVQYALPYELQTDWLYINTALFNKYNITVPTIGTGWTWSQFITACNTLNASGVTPVAMSGADAWAMTFPECYMFERVNGLSAFTNALARNTNFTTYYTNAFNAIKQWVDGNYFETGWQTLHYTDAAQLFQSGSAAMWIQGTWGVGMISDNASIPMQLGVAQWPYFPDHPEANKAIFGSFTNVAVAAAGKHKTEAEDFLRFISKPEWIVKYAQQTYNPVAQTVTLPTGTYPPVMTDIQTAIANAPMLHIRFGSLAPKDLAATLDEQNLLVWTGQKSPADAAAAIEAKAVGVLGPVHG
jgi:raffinose/stachyose/melibiose transport system substrate-binding protein